MVGKEETRGNLMKGNVLRAVELSDPTSDAPPVVPLRLDIGCGRTTPEGWTGVDSLNFGQKWIADLSSYPWLIHGDAEREVSDKPGPYLTSTKLRQDDVKGKPKFYLKEQCVDDVRSSHFVEHLTGAERVGFFNELYRVMKPGATALIITPSWSHACAYGDPTHQWPPMSPWYPLYLNKQWRDANAPHVGYTCDFDWIFGASWDPSINDRNDDVRNFMMDKNINSMRDLHVTLTARPAATT